MTQPALFPTPAPRRRKPSPAAPEPAPTLRTGPRLGEPHDQADAELGRQCPYITPARAQQIRRELDARQTLVSATTENTRTSA